MSTLEKDLSQDGLTTLPRRQKDDLTHIGFCMRNSVWPTQKTVQIDQELAMPAECSLLCIRLTVHVVGAVQMVHFSETLG